jgi:hypothetical protein
MALWTLRRVGLALLTGRGAGGIRIEDFIHLAVVEITEDWNREILRAVKC